MERYKVILAYDGTEYSGFQRLGRSRLDTPRWAVQDVVEKALRQIGWQDRAIQAAGRTDTGVHATGQVVAFNCDWRHTPQALGLALNAHLPADVAVREVQQVAAGFDPRRHALSRTYHYHIFCDELRDPLKERYAWRVWPVVRLDLLQEAAAALIGLHNFAAFGTPPRAKSSTIREIFQAGWTTQEDRLVFTVTANAFLYHMVRHMVALQVAIGQGKVSAQIIPSLFDQGAAPVQGLAPAAGLFLTEVRYPPQPVDDTQASN